MRSLVTSGAFFALLLQSTFAHTGAKQELGNIFKRDLNTLLARAGEWGDCVMECAPFVLYTGKCVLEMVTDFGVTTCQCDDTMRNELQDCANCCIEAARSNDAASAEATMRDFREGWGSGCVEALDFITPVCTSCEVPETVEPISEEVVEDAQEEEMEAQAEAEEEVTVVLGEPVSATMSEILPPRPPLTT